MNNKYKSIDFFKISEQESNEDDDEDALPDVPHSNLSNLQEDQTNKIKQTQFSFLSDDEIYDDDVQNELARVEKSIQAAQELSKQTLSFKNLPHNENGQVAPPSFLNDDFDFDDVTIDNVIADYYKKKLSDNRHMQHSESDSSDDADDEKMPQIQSHLGKDLQIIKYDQKSLSGVRMSSKKKRRPPRKTPNAQKNTIEGFLEEVQIPDTDVRTSLVYNTMQLCEICTDIIALLSCENHIGHPETSFRSSCRKPASCATIFSL